MSKISEIKKSQGYQESPVMPHCNNCLHFTSDKEKTKYGSIQEKNIRCGKGGFAVKKLGTCNLHQFKPKD